MFHFKWYYTCSENYAFSKGKKGTQLTKNTTNIYIFIKINVTKMKYFPFTTYIPHTTQHASFYGRGLGCREGERRRRRRGG
jgi:hypothetical protein